MVAAKNNANTNLDFGVRVDCLWELLFHHHLANQVKFAADPASLSLRRYERPDPKEAELHTAVRLVHECDRLLLDAQYVLAAEYCNRAIHFAPAYAKAYQMRSEALNEFVAFNRKRLDREEQRHQLQWALDDAKRYLTMSSDPAALLDVCMRRIWLQWIANGSLYDPDVTSMTTKLLEGDLLAPDQRAYAYRIRAASEQTTATPPWRTWTRRFGWLPTKSRVSRLRYARRLLAKASRSGPSRRGSAKGARTSECGEEGGQGKTFSPSAIARRTTSPGP